MQRFLSLFLGVSVFFISGCTTTDIMFWQNGNSSIIEVVPDEESILTNAPETFIQELKPVPIDEPFQIIAPDTSVSTEKARSQIRS